MPNEINRRPIFQAVKQLRKGAPFTPPEVAILDAAIDEAFASMDVSAPVMDATIHVPGGLRSPAIFYDHLRNGKLFGPDLSASEVDGVGAIIAACDGWPVAWTAYAMATAYLETAHSMQPIHEYGGPTYFRRMYDIQGARPDKARELGNTAPGDGARYAGRGYVQLTGKNNYAKASKVVGVDLVADPDAAMRPDIAAAIMANGMANGWFTGKSLADYLPKEGGATAVQFRPARRIINGTDRADDVASYAVQFQEGLTLGGWGAL